jgi:hypothetical protein
MFCAWKRIALRAAHTATLIAIPVLAVATVAPAAWRSLAPQAAFAVTPPRASIARILVAEENSPLDATWTFTSAAAVAPKGKDNAPGQVKQQNGSQSASPYAPGHVMQHP